MWTASWIPLQPTLDRLQPVENTGADLGTGLLGRHRHSKTGWYVWEERSWWPVQCGQRASQQRI